MPPKLLQLSHTIEAVMQGPELVPDAKHIQNSFPSKERFVGPHKIGVQHPAHVFMQHPLKRGGHLFHLLQKSTDECCLNVVPACPLTAPDAYVFLTDDS